MPVLYHLYGPDWLRGTQLMIDGLKVAGNELDTPVTAMPPSSLIAPLFTCASSVDALSPGTPTSTTTLPAATFTVTDDAEILNFSAICALILFITPVLRSSMEPPSVRKTCFLALDELELDDEEEEDDEDDEEEDEEDEDEDEDAEEDAEEDDEEDDDEDDEDSSLLEDDEEEELPSVQTKSAGRTYGFAALYRVPLTKKLAEVDAHCILSHTVPRCLNLYVADPQPGAAHVVPLHFVPFLTFAHLLASNSTLLLVTSIGT